MSLLQLACPSQYTSARIPAYQKQAEAKCFSMVYEHEKRLLAEA
jgi:hypothetical protein